MMAALAGSDLAIVHLLIGTLISGCLSSAPHPPAPPLGRAPRAPARHPRAACHQAATQCPCHALCTAACQSRLRHLSARCRPLSEEFALAACTRAVSRAAGCNEPAASRACTSAATVRRARWLAARAPSRDALSRRAGALTAGSGLAAAAGARSACRAGAARASTGAVGGCGSRRLPRHGGEGGEASNGPA